MRQRFGRIRLVFFFIALLCTQAYSQSSNPFEIRSRLDSVARLPASGEMDSLALTATTDSLTTAPFSESGQAENSSVNPFDVDHQPLRKLPSVSSGETPLPQTGSTGNKSGSNAFLFWILLLATALLAIVINIRFSVIRLVFRSLINMNLFKLFHREEGGQITVSDIFLYIIFIVNVSVAGYLVMQEDKLLTGWTGWLMIAASLSAFYLVKHGLILTFGGIFDIQKTTSLYNFSIFSYHVFLGIILLPVTFTASFAPGMLSGFFINLAIITICIVMVLKVVRGLLISLEFWGDRFFQFFMYLCTFEILPVLILVKFLLYHVNL